MADLTPKPCGHAQCQPWPTCQYRRDSCAGCVDLAVQVERLVAERVAAARADERERLAYRPYAPDAPLVAVHEQEWEDAEAAMSCVPNLEDDLANARAYERRVEVLVERLERLIATVRTRSPATITVDYIEHVLNEYDGGDR